MMNNETYWFARGYYDGRTAGVGDDALRDMLTDKNWSAYMRGYGTGVTDYCNKELAEME